jgi:hypothetical protein
MQTLGTYNVWVMACAEIRETHIDSDWSELFTFEVAQLEAPVLTVTETDMTWNTVRHATAYEVSCEHGTITETTETQITLSDLGTFFFDTDGNPDIGMEGLHEIKVRAISSDPASITSELSKESFQYNVEHKTEVFHLVSLEFANTRILADENVFAQKHSITELIIGSKLTQKGSTVNLLLTDNTPIDLEYTASQDENIMTVIIEGIAHATYDRTEESNVEIFRLYETTFDAPDSMEEIYANFTAEVSRILGKPLAPKDVFFEMINAEHTLPDEVAHLPLPSKAINEINIYDRCLELMMTNKYDEERVKGLLDREFGTKYKEYITNLVLSESAKVRAEYETALENSTVKKVHDIVHLSANLAYYSIRITDGQIIIEFSEILPAGITANIFVVYNSDM